jgi:hypothetical protein
MHGAVDAGQENQNPIPNLDFHQGWELPPNLNFATSNFSPRAQQN